MDRQYQRGREILKVGGQVTGDRILLRTDTGERVYSWRALSEGEYLLRENGRQYRVVVARDGKERWVWIEGHVHHLRLVTGTRKARAEEEGSLAAPMNGLVLKVLVQPGQAVRKKQPLVVLEAMKMQYEITAPRDGVVRAVNCEEGQQVQGGLVLVHLDSEAATA